MSVLRLHCIQHVPFEGIGTIADWASSRGHKVTFTLLWQRYDLPAMDAFDMLVIMGGPMSILDEEKYPWLKAEKSFVEEAVKHKKTILGICLGAQLVANVLGADVYPNPCKEIGWFPVEFTEKSLKILLFKDFTKELTVFHWHGETFNLPKGATLVASSKACRNQAFYYPDNIVGLQFHMESTAESINLLLSNCGNELVDASYIQNKTVIQSAMQTNMDIMSSFLFNLLDRLASASH